MRFHIRGCVLLLLLSAVASFAQGPPPSYKSFQPQPPSRSFLLMVGSDPVPHLLPEEAEEIHNFQNAVGLLKAKEGSDSTPNMLAAKKQLEFLISNLARIHRIPADWSFDYTRMTFVPPPVAPTASR